MRIAAGVLLIIVSLSNLFGGLVYAGLGGLIGVGGEIVEEGEITVTDEDGKETTISDKETGREMKKTGGLVILWGLGLLILGGLNIAAAVLLFTAKNPMFVMVVAGVEAAADVGTVVFAQTFIWTTIGLVAAAMAFFSAKSLDAEGV